MSVTSGCANSCSTTYGSCEQFVQLTPEEMAQIYLIEHGDKEQTVTMTHEQAVKKFQQYKVAANKLVKVTAVKK